MRYIEMIEKEIDKLAATAEKRRALANPQEVQLMANLLYICRHFCDEDGEVEMRGAAAKGSAVKNPY